jgi:hypothetical protein
VAKAAWICGDLVPVAQPTNRPPFHIAVGRGELLKRKPCLIRYEGAGAISG